MAYKYQQGLYTPKNPGKYLGDVTKIRYMSSYELHMHTFLDNNPNVIAWNSEGVIIPYVKPTDGKVHRYLVDYFVQYKNKSGEIICELIEVKPESQTKKSRSRNPKTKLVESLTYAVNLAKWEAATKYAKERGWKFKIITERSLFS